MRIYSTLFALLIRCNDETNKDGDLVFRAVRDPASQHSSFAAASLFSTDLRTMSLYDYCGGVTKVGAKRKSTTSHEFCLPVRYVPTSFTLVQTGIRDMPLFL